MKKVLFVLLSILIILNLGSVCFAATGNTTATQTTNITDQDTAAGAAYTEVPDNVVPGGSGKGNAQTMDITDQEIPKALPKTGGIPAEAFYGAGGLLIAGALVVSMKKPKASKS